jgi:hypothetical protein
MLWKGFISLYYKKGHFGFLFYMIFDQNQKEYDSKPASSFFFIANLLDLLNSFSVNITIIYHFFHKDDLSFLDASFP